MKVRTNRRDFMRAGFATGAAAFAAPLLVPASAFGANDRIVIGGIGVGNQGNGNMRALRGSCSIAAIADVYLPRAEAFAKSVGAQHAYQDYRKLLEHDDIDAVVICTPHHSNASRNAATRSPTPRRGTGRPRFATWATSPVG